MAVDAASLLQAAARQLGESLDPEAVYDHFHELVAEVIPHNGLVVSSYDDAAGEIRCEYAWVDGSKLDPSTFPPLQINRSGEGMQSHVILTGEGLLANDVAERVEEGKGTYYDVDAEGNVRKVPESGPTSVGAALMAPVKLQGRVVGVVQVMSEEQLYTEEQLELMEGIVAQMAAAVRNARLYEAARANEARLRAIFDSAAAGIAEVGLDGRWLRVNDRLCEITGYSEEELLALTFDDITHPDDRAADHEQDERMLAGQIERYAREKRYLRKDGGEVAVTVTVSLVRDSAGSPLRYVSVIEDVTARREAEEERRRLVAAEAAARALAGQRAQEARVLSAMGDGIALVDHDGIVRVWNRAAERMLGLSAAQVDGRRLEDVLPAWREVRERVTPRTEESRRDTVPIEAGGRELWLSVVAVETPDGVVYAFADVTEERRLDEAKSELVATVSHELRTPLAAVYGAAQTLLHRDSYISPEERAALLDMIAVQTQRLAQIADQFLLASRLESGELPVAIDVVDVGRLARETAAAMRESALGRVIEVEVEATVPPARGDPDRLRQVLVNLVDNAVKYSPDGGDVSVSVKSLNGSVRLSVRDRGLGISHSEQERVFEKFYRVDTQLARAPGGTGLGLYICRALVLRMGGRIGLESEEGKGSTFFVELPRA